MVDTQVEVAHGNQLAHLDLAFDDVMACRRVFNLTNGDHLKVSTSHQAHDSLLKYLLSLPVKVI
jgi:hypothetical protein